MVLDPHRIVAKQSNVVTEAAIAKSPGLAYPALMADSTAGEAHQAELFERIALGYDEAIRRYQPTYEAMLRLSTDLARVSAPGGSRCLDYGTGTGTALPLLNPHFDELVAIDPVKAMLDLARARTKAECGGSSAGEVVFIEGTVVSREATMLADSSFDAVHCSLVLMFVKNDPEKLDVLKSFHRLLRAGGALVLTELVVDAEPSNEETTVALWRALMRHRGADDAFIAVAERQLHDLMHRRTIDQTRSLLGRAGFGSVALPFQTLHTVMLLATK